MTGQSFKDTAVFLGPTLRADRARALLDADYYPPARKGDIYRISTSGVKRVVLIDGVFHGTPSVWQRELLYAINNGIQVLGASSMGAIRAAELYKFGMIGHGRVFEWYRDGIIDGDDEVALHHGTEESGYLPLSEPLVNIRATLLAAINAQLLEPHHAEEIIAWSRKQHFPTRTYSQLLKSSQSRGCPKHQVRRLEEFFANNRVDIKSLDAEGVLRLAARLNGGKPKPPKRKITCMVDESSHRDEWDDVRLVCSGFVSSRGIVTGREILDVVRRDSKMRESMFPELSKRFFLQQWAEQNGVSCPNEFLRRYMRQWTVEHKVSDLATWTRANGLTKSTFSKLLKDRALIHWLTEPNSTNAGSERRLVFEWARQNGVSRKRKDRGDRSIAELEQWIINKGPNYFGFDWSFAAALLRELQITGMAADLSEKVSTR